MKKYLFLLFGFLLLASCSKLDFNQVETGQPYVGLFQGKKCAVVFDQAEEGTVIGRAYFDEGNLFAEPVSFTSDLMKNGKGKIYHDGVDGIVKGVSFKEGKLFGKVDGETFAISLSDQTSLVFHPDFKEPIYECFQHEDVVYAKNVKGYWSTYNPRIELEENSDYAKVYGFKVPQLLKTNDLDLNMDLYRPITDSSHCPLPLLVLIHGGAFYCGDKCDTGFPEMGHYFAERGYVVASINYRLGFWPWSQSVDRAGYRAVQDANAAVRFLLDKKEYYNIDPDNIYVAGSSAGAITALNLAFMDSIFRPEASRGLVGDSFKQSLFNTLEWAEGLKQKILSWTGNGVDWVINKLNGILEGMDFIGFSIPERQGRIIGYLKDLDVTKLPEALGLDYDLGEINSVKINSSNLQTDIPFKVKGVVNMWGAVHDLDMLQTSPNTSILSFHGNNDCIVPYDYNYPFEGMLDEYSENILNVISFNSESIYDFILTMMPESEKLNQLAFRPMYGSSKIDGFVRVSNLRRSELHTLEGGGHSLHREGDVLSPYFYDTILPVMTRFLYEEVVGGKAVRLVRDGAWYEAFAVENVAEFHWHVEGGAVIAPQGDAKAKVLFFGDAPKHSVAVCGRYKNGVEYMEKIDL